MNQVLHFDTLKGYCKGINIAPPKWTDFDVRTFGANMKTVHHKMPPFKHEFYAIALKLAGEGYAKTGNFSTEELESTLFFNSPYQILQWDIAPNWNGLYVIFSEEFYRKPHHKNRITEHFPFLLSDHSIPLKIPGNEIALFQKIIEDILHEFRLEQPNCRLVIQSYLEILLLKTARLFQDQFEENTIKKEERNSDIRMVGRFKTLIEESFQPSKSYDGKSPHQVQFYAEKMHVHPNHLNSVIRRITDTPASELIQKHMLSLAKSRLKNTNLSIKEIAFELHYNYPNHFANFFKKQLGVTPNQYRNS